MPATNGAVIPENNALPGNVKKGAEKHTGRRSSSPSSGSESSDSSDVELLPEEPSPIPPTYPTDPIDAASYDTLKAVWYPRNRRPDAEKIKSALVDFNNVVKGVRDAWKEKSQAMKASENKGESDKSNELKKDVVLQRHLMDAVVRTTLEMGHPTFIEKYVLSFFSPFITSRSLSWS